MDTMDTSIPARGNLRDAGVWERQRINTKIVREDIEWKLRFTETSLGPVYGVMLPSMQAPINRTPYIIRQRLRGLYYRLDDFLVILDDYMMQNGIYPEEWGSRIRLDIKRRTSSTRPYRESYSFVFTLVVDPGNPRHYTLNLVSASQDSLIPSEIITSTRLIMETFSQAVSNMEGGRYTCDNETDDALVPMQEPLSFVYNRRLEEYLQRDEDAYGIKTYKRNQTLLHSLLNLKTTAHLTTVFTFTMPIAIYAKHTF